MSKFFIPALAGAAFLLNGCVAKTVWDVATLPVKAGSQAADWATTSQSESDRNYGKKMREKEAREGRARRDYEKACKQDRSKCDRYDGYRASDD
jgi:hypothetical protein